MARAAAPMLRGLRGLTSTTRKRSSAECGDKGDEFTAGEKSMKERDKEEPSKSKSPPEGHATRPPGRRLAWAARGNIDCGQVEIKSVPAWTKAPPLYGAAGTAESIRSGTPTRSESSVPSVVGGASDRGAAVWSMCRRNAEPAGRSVWQLHWKPGLMKRRS